MVNECASGVNATGPSKSGLRNPGTQWAESITARTMKRPCNTVPRAPLGVRLHSSARSMMDASAAMPAGRTKPTASPQA